MFAVPVTLAERKVGAINWHRYSILILLQAEEYNRKSKAEIAALLQLIDN